MEDLDMFYRNVTSQFRLASDPSRLRMLFEIEAGELSVGEIAAALGKSQPVVSASLSPLRLVGIVDGRREGHQVRYSLTGRGKLLLAAARAIGSV